MPDTHTRTQHTPGPWKLGERRHVATAIEALDGNYIVVQISTHSRGTDGITYREVPEHIANARLMAAAPDLLSACEMMEDADTQADRSLAWLAIRAAIRKARGEE